MALSVSSSEVGSEGALGDKEGKWGRGRTGD